MTKTLLQERSQGVSDMRIRRCETYDLPQLFELFKEVYPANPPLSDPNYFDWQFKDTPFDEDREYKFWILENHSELKGFLGFMPVEFWYEGKIYRGGWTLNWKTMDRNISGLVLLTRFMQDFDRRFFIGLTENSAKIYQHYHIPLQLELPRWVAILEPEKVAAMFQISHPVHLQTLQKSFQQIIRYQESKNTSFVDRFVEGEEFRWNQWPSIKGYIRRTGKYLNWRYFDIPNSTYRAVRNEESFAVYRIEKIKGYEESVVRILEWHLKGEQAQETIAVILNEARKSGAILIDFFCTSPQMGDELARLGFVPDSDFNPVRIPYLFRPICYAEGIRLAIDFPPHRKEKNFYFKEWYITKGDSDLDRIKL